ncbi:MAG TPA: hypothetical protein VL068_12970, partial [Microthrixaceae bacterium]|nr:hypothetical protein [Microthrixaceae bacterium]
VPIHLNGTGRVLPKGSSRPEPQTVVVNFGDPIVADEGIDARKFVEVISSSIESLADETATDWWSARMRAGSGTTPSLAGPEVTSWRRDWTSPEKRSRRKPSRRWPS